MQGLSLVAKWEMGRPIRNTSRPLLKWQVDVANEKLFVAKHLTHDFDDVISASNKEDDFYKTIIV